MRGTYFRIYTAYFPMAYLDSLQRGSRPTDQVYLRRSKVFNMKEVDDRKDALLVVLAILQYFRSGNSRIATLQSVQWARSGTKVS